MRSVLSTLVFATCLPICIAGGVVLLAGIGIGWCAVQLAPGGRAELDTFGVPLRSVR